MRSPGDLRAAIAAACLIVVSGALAADAGQADPPPAWAFPLNPPHKTDPDAPNRVHHVRGSALAFSDKQLNDRFFTIDWFPKEHGPMPPVVAAGRRPDVSACTYCHMASGTGGPAEAALPGLPESYIVEQFGEFRSGRRRAAQPRMLSPNDMVDEARHANAQDVQAAAAYFSRQRFASHFHVVETDTVPKTSVQGVSLYAKVPGAGREPIGQRIVEIPDDFKQLELGDPHSEFTTYAPRGSIARGKALVASGAGAAPCRSCHGPDLRGAGSNPPLAGRSASYLARQLYDIQYGFRSGPAVAPMLPEVAHMTAADRIAIVAYLTSLPG